MNARDIGVVVGVALVLITWVSAAYVVLHFIIKFW